MIERYAKWIAWSGAILSILFAGIGAFFYFQTRGPRYVFWANSVANSVPYAIVGAIILSRLPRNRIGWLYCASFIWAIDGLLSAYGGYLLSEQPTSILGTWLIWVASWTWLFGVLPNLLSIMLFPTGAVVSPRWRLGIVFLFIGTLLPAIATAVYPGELPIFHLGIRFQNPFGWVGAESFLNILLFVGVTLLTAAGLTAALGLIVRYRRSQGLEREQLKWFVFGGVISQVVLPFTGTGFVSETMGGVLAAIVSPLAPIAAGIAILRYRLFDIDIIIRRTLVYGVLTGVFALVFNITEIVVQQLVSNLTGQSSEIAIILSTLAIAALFNPLQKRVQDIVDRRFYRRKYDAQQVLAQFAKTARDETDIDKLTNELMRVVDETMQPESVMLWLKKTDDRKRRTDK